MLTPDDDLRVLIQQNPRNKTNYYNMGVRCYENDQFEDAIKYFNVYLDRIDDTLCKIGVALYYCANRGYRPFFEIAAKINPTNILASVFLQADEAVITFLSKVNFTPNYLQERIDKKKEELQNDPKNICKMAEYALLRSRPLTTASNNLKGCYQDDCLEITDLYNEANKYIALSYCLTRDSIKTKQLFKRIIYLNEWMDFEFRFLENILAKAHNYLKEGSLYKAICIYSSILDIKSDFIDALSGMGDALLAAGEIKRAIEAYEKSLKQAYSEHDMKGIKKADPVYYEKHYDRLLNLPLSDE